MLDLSAYVEKITPEHFSKYHNLVDLIRDRKHGLGWTGKDTRDRLVIFTERIETLRFLRKHLPQDLGLEAKQVEALHGTFSDIEQQRIVEDFGKEEAPVRLLIASDVASEGINLHFLCHRMIHFDIPWSLMVFQQRNGRIDRYGQEHTPHIIYLVTQSLNPKIRGDTRILELLIQKDEQAVKNIGDPSALMGVYDIDEEEKITARAMERDQTPEEFEASLAAEARARATAFDPLALFMGEGKSPTESEAVAKTRSLSSLFPNDFAYLQSAIAHLRQSQPLQVEFTPSEQRADLTPTEELKQRFRFLPREIWPEDGAFTLSPRQEVIQEEIKRSRKDETAWPRIHYLWPLNPVMEWVNDKVLAAFGRHEAPVIVLPGALAARDVIFVLCGLIPNRKSHPLVHRWFGASFRNEAFLGIEDFDAVLERTGLARQSFPNRGDHLDLESLAGLLPEAVAKAREWMSGQRKIFEEAVNEKLNQHYRALERLKEKQLVQLEMRFVQSQQPERIVLGRKEEERRRINQLFVDYLTWIEETMTTEDHPYLQVVAVLQGAD